MNKKVIALALASICLTACTSFGDRNSAAYDKVQERAKLRVGEEMADRTPSGESVVREHKDTPFMDFKEVGLRSMRGDINLKATDTPFGALITETAKKAGYSVIFAENVDHKKKISVAFNNATPETVLRESAFMAGYVAVFNKSDKTVSIADTATLVYKVPTSLFQGVNANISIGGSPSSTSASGSGSSGGSSQGAGVSVSGGSSSGASLKADFTINGKVGMTSGSFMSALNKQAGQSAEITVVPETGMITVRANAQALKRVTEFIKAAAIDAMIEVSIEQSIVEVSLKDQFERGIDWNRTLSGIAGMKGAWNLALGTAASVSNPAITATYTSAGISAIIKALQQYTHVDVTTKPKILTTNHVPATLFEGTSTPFLGSVTSSMAGTTGATQTSGSASYATEGLSFSVQPDVIDNQGKTVQLSIMPVKTTLGNWHDFNLSGSSLRVPEQQSEQSFMRTTVESNRTLIIGGISQKGYNSNTKTFIPVIAEGATKGNVAKETVMLLHVKTRIPKEVDPIVSESL